MTSPVTSPNHARTIARDSPGDEESAQHGAVKGVPPEDASAEKPAGNERAFCCCCPRTCAGKSMCALCCCVTLVALASAVGFCVVFFYPQPPQWELKTVLLENVQIPGLSIPGLRPADTSTCPPLDPCGMLGDSECSVCSEPGDMNLGCLCQVPPENPSAGSMIPADTSGCPLLDLCGVWPMNRGCSRCPDDSWINDGCFCRQPYTWDDFVDGWEDFVGMFRGEAQQPIVLELTAVVEVLNPNKIGATTEPGSIDVYYEDTLLGRAELDEMEVEPNKAQTMEVHVVIDNVDMEVGMRIVQELLRNNLHFPVKAEGSMFSNVAFLRVKTDVVCNVVADVGNGANIIKKDCTYTYG